MTSHLNSHRTTDIKPEMLSGVQTGNETPHDKYIIRGIAHAQTNRKDDIFVQRRLVQNFILAWGQGLVYSRSTHSPGHIPGIFSLHASYSDLRHFINAISQNKTTKGVSRHLNLIRYPLFHEKVWNSKRSQISGGNGGQAFSEKLSQKKFSYSIHSKLVQLKVKGFFPIPWIW